MSIEGQLIALNDEKRAQREVLIAQGQDMTNIPFTQYHEKIAAIEAGTTAPEDVYAITRPVDWLPMPEVGENEIYLLFHLLPTENNFISFSLVCTGQYMVKWGTVVDGVFTAIGSESKNSNAAYQGNFSYDDWGDELSTGERQVMLQLSGVNITAFNLLYHPDRNRSDIKQWRIVEFRGKLPNVTSCILGGSTVPAALVHLRYFSLEGTNNITNNTRYMLATCLSLIAILQLDTSKMTTADYMFYNSPNLSAVPQFDFSKATSMQYTFSGVGKLDLSFLDLSSVVGATGLFSSSTTVQSVSTLTSGLISLANNLYNNSYLIDSIHMDISSITQATNMIFNNYNLSKIILTGTNTSYPAVISLANSALSLFAFREFAENLPDISSSTSRNITMTSTPAAIDQTDTEWLAIIATLNTKGWTVTV